jgi:putrescine transport system permease protein
MTRESTSRSAARRVSWGPRLVVAIPYLWLIVFFLIPFAIVARISLSETAIAQPPYTPTLDFGGGFSALRDFLAALSFANYARLASDWLYVSSYLRSIWIALSSTMLLLLIGFPIAYAMARAPRRWQPLLFMLIVLPFWTSFLIRIYAWMTILQREGLLNQLLLMFGIVDAPPVWLSTDAAIYIGIVYTYLPFMVLPLYATLEKMDESLLEAAADLGCPR